MRFGFDQDRQPEMVIESLCRDGVLERVSDRDDDARRWMDCDLCSFIENRCHEVVEPNTLTEDARIAWSQRAMAGDEQLADPRRMQYVAAFWIVDRGEWVGTVALEASTFRQFVPVHSLYVFPQHRGRGCAYSMLQRANQACVAAGYEGILIGTYWTWQNDVRRYLHRYRMWARSFKRSLDFTWADLPQHTITIGESDARFAIEHSGGAIDLLTATRDGDRLCWTETAAMADDELDESVQFHARPTFAVALALQGWPLVRSAEQLADAPGWDIGGPEILARKIAIFEWLDRRRGFDIRTPRIPGLPYDDIERELEKPD